MAEFCMPGFLLLKNMYTGYMNIYNKKYTITISSTVIGVIVENKTNIDLPNYPVGEGLCSLFTPIRYGWGVCKEYPMFLDGAEC